VRRKSGTIIIWLATALASFTLIISCNDATGPPTEFGHAELIYKYVSDSVFYFYVADVSPDGDAYLIWAYISSTMDPALFLLNLETNDLKLICSGPKWTFYEPKLSPDKKNVVFMDLSGIYVVNTNGGEPRRIYGHGLQSTSTQWVDEETVLMYVLEDWWDINTINVNTLEINTLFTVIGTDVRSTYLSPDGEYLFVKGEAPEPGNPDDYYNLFRIYDTETWEYEEYVPGENDINYLPDGPWSPDGTKIGTVTGPNTHLRYFDVEAEADVMVFRSDKLLLTPYFHVIWSPDGKHFLASEDRDDNILRVFAIDVE
jgi:Tol biopolymer transport system component